ncbi:MAG: hypothetical protein RR646_03200 [Erysipelotrichaceae bacterium]
MLKKEDERKEEAILELDDIVDEISMLSQLKEIMDVPPFIAMDWETLELMLSSTSHLPKTLYIKGWNAIKEKDPIAANRLETIINNYNATQIHFTCNVVYQD